MKKLTLLIILLFLLQITIGQVETRFFPEGNAYEQVAFIKNYPEVKKLYELPSFDIQKLINEDEFNEGKDFPFRFGKGFDTNITLSDGNWINIGIGRLWTMEFRSEGAYSLNFVFDDFYLSENAQLYIINKSGSMLYGPVTSKQNTKNGYFMTDLIQGDDVIIYLFEPTKEEGDESRLTIKRVVHAYRNLFPNKTKGFGGSQDCNNDINCFPAWDNSSDAVALVLIAGGTLMCSGSLLTTTNYRFKPYFLSAFHCVDIINEDDSLSADEITIAENWMFKYQYKVTSCGGSTLTYSITYNSAELRAAWDVSDFVLMEMNDSPFGDGRFSWLGWDRSGDTPSSGTGIHHPKGDVMKISLDYNTLEETSREETSGSGFWMVSWDDGVVEGGSSGSPLFDQNKRVVGQLWGGEHLCYIGVDDWYGCFHASWIGGETNSTRLSNWLDPTGTGDVTTNTIRSPYISGPKHVCYSSGSQYTVEDIPEGSTSYNWNVSYNLTIESGGGTKNAIIRSANLSSGPAWIDFSFYWNGYYFQIPHYAVAANPPLAQDIVLFVYEGYELIPGYGSVWFLEPNTSYYMYLDYNNNWDCSISNIDYNLPPSFTIIYENGNYVYFRTPSTSSGYSFSVDAQTCCGVTQEVKSGYFVVGYGIYSLIFSPNPATGETIVTLADKNGEISETLEWDMEVYDLGQFLTVKKEKITGKQQILNVSNWKKGVYIVKAIVGDEVVFGKLVVE